MQEEVNKKMIALSIKTLRVTADGLKYALQKQLAAMQSRNNPAYRGKQTLKQLVKQNTGVSNIEITDSNIKSFERIAKKYGIDYALKKDITQELPRYLVFFKGGDVDVMTQAFKEYSAKVVEKQQKPSIREQLSIATKLLKQQKQREKIKEKDRGVEH